MSARRVIAPYAAWMGVLVSSHFAVPALHTVAGALVGLSGATAIGIGILRHRPRRAYAWWFLAGSLLASTAGDVAYSLAPDLPQGPSATAADVFYLLMVPLVATGLLGLTRANRVARDRSGLLDFLIFSTTATFLLWVFVLNPYLTASGLGSVEQSALATYALADLLVLATTVWLLASTARSRAALLLVIGAAGMLAADVHYGVATIEGTWRSGGPIELGWLAFYISWGAAALHPSMATLTEPAEPRQRPVNRLRFVLLALSVALAPGVLLLEALAGDVRDGLVVAVVSGVTFVLVLTRLADAADAHRLAVARERSLRQAGAELVAAADVADVDRSVRTSVARLVPPGAAHRIVFAVNQADGVLAAAESIWGPAVATGSGPTPSAAAARRTRVLRVRTLHPALAEQLAGFESAVLCPLVLNERRTGVPRIGALFVAADSAVLAALRDSLELLAAQASLALERIGLNQEVNRRASEEYFRTLVQSTTDVILIVDDDDRIRYASPSVAMVLGVDPATCADLRSVVHGDDVASIRALAAGARSARAPGASSEFGEPAEEWTDWSVLRPDGERVHLEVSCRDLRRERTLRGLVITMRNVTERRRLERELSHRALHDSLTGLANWVAFQDRVHEAVEQARGSGRTVAALFIDLDEFAAVNDKHGHATGDGLLVAAGQRMREVIDGQGLVARVGGDEFAVLLPHADDPEQPERLAVQLLGALAGPISVGEAVVAGSASIGVATTADANDAQELLRHAGVALYVAKSAGKGRCRPYQPALHAAMVERLELRAALAKAVAELSFSVEYQPIVDLGTGETVGFEALARWHHPTLGLVPPEQFIAMAEETDLIEPIGDWVLRQAVSTAAGWRRAAEGANTPYVSINVSAGQLRTQGFVEKVGRVLAEAGVPPAGVMLEITESMLLRDDEQVWAELATLRSAGLRVAIDDFGTGFSSLSYLLQIPIDVLKIDRSFIRTVASSQRQRTLVEGIVRLADRLGLDSIAEGIETELDRALLSRMGCGSGQGYLFSRPLGEQDAARWLRGGHNPVPVQRHPAAG